MSQKHIQFSYCYLLNEYLSLSRWIFSHRNVHLDERSLDILSFFSFELLLKRYIFHETPYNVSVLRRFENKQMFCRQGCRCEQQYRLHRLLAYDPSNDCRGIFSDWFKFPSCCVCRCYDLPNDLRITSRSPRADGGTSNDLDTWFQNPLNP